MRRALATLTATVLLAGTGLGLTAAPAAAATSANRIPGSPGGSGKSDEPAI